MNIAFLIDKYGGQSIGGGEVHIDHLKRHLVKKYKCHCRIFGQSYDALWVRLLWDIYIIPIVIISHVFRKIDVLHSHGFSTGLVAWLLSKILKVPVVHTVHGSHLMDLGDKTIKGKLEAFFLTQLPYDAEITVSKSFLKYTHKAKILKVITNGVEIPVSSRAITKTLNTISNTPNVIPGAAVGSLSPLYTSSKPIILLTVSRLELQKGNHILIEAIASIKSQLPPWQLRIVGSGSQLKDLKKLSKRLKLSDYIKFTGKKTGKQLAQEYRKANLFILPSLAEGQPIVILEAWANKIPVIATHVGHNPYMIKNGQTGWLAAPNDLESLGKTILTAFKQIDHWPEIGSHCLAMAKGSYSWNQIAEQTYGLYTQIIKKNRNHYVISDRS